MALPTPLYDLKRFPNVYEPSEDTFLFLDAIEADLHFLKSKNPTCIIEIGSGSGVVITFLAEALQNCAFFSTDINPEACLATAKTASLNNRLIECISMDLLSNFKQSSFDVILFNPPYVVTDDAEIEEQGLSRAWAGGTNGRRVIDRLLLGLKNLLNDSGVCYMVLVKENKLEELCEVMREKGFNCSVVKERKILGEHLFVLRFVKK